jgi:hypothetical protein
MLGLIVVLALPAAQAADVPWWLIIIGIVWLISTLAGGRRRLRQATQTLESDATAAEQSPETQRLAHTVQSIAAQAQASAGTMDQQVLARAQAAAAAAAAASVRPAAAMGHDPGAIALARQTLLGDLAGTLKGLVDQGTPARPDTTLLVQPAAPAVRTGRLAQLATPDGLAFAILAQAVIGPCVALRSEPIEPGGW